MYHAKNRFLFAMCATLLLCINLHGNDRDNQALGFLKEAYLRNREAFTIIDCSFEWREGKAATRKDAFEGRFIGEQKVRRGQWLVDGPLVRYELLCSPELVQETKRILAEGLKKETSVSIPCADRYYLRNDKYSLRYGSVNLTANLFINTDQDPEGIRISPFNPDCLGPDEYSSPARYLQEALNGRYEAKFLGTKQIDGVDMLVVTVASGLRQKFGFDPKRNYLMTYASDTDTRSEKRYYEVIVLESRQCSGDRWFPMRIVSILSPDTSSPFEVRELKVLKLDVDSKPASERFQLELPTEAQVNSIGRMEWLNIRHTTTIFPQDLASLHVQMKQAGDNYIKQTGTQDQGRKTNPSRRNILLFLSVIMLLILGIVIFFRWRKPNYRTSQ